MTTRGMRLNNPGNIRISVANWLGKVTPSGTNVTIAATGGSTPGGNPNTVQYNNAGALGGIVNTTTDGTNLIEVK